jgi:hypothetical protein
VTQDAQGCQADDDSLREVASAHAALTAAIASDDEHEPTVAVLLVDGSTTLRPGFCTIGQVSAAGGSRRCYG